MSKMVVSREPAAADLEVLPAVDDLAPPAPQPAEAGAAPPKKQLKRETNN